MTARPKLRHRFNAARLAWQGIDVLHEHGTQRTGPDGRTETLVKLPMASWIPSDDIDMATAMFAKAIDDKFNVDWDDPTETKTLRSSAAAMRRLDTEVGGQAT